MLLRLFLTLELALMLKKNTGTRLSTWLFKEITPQWSNC
ncbi:hypothetical protein X975_14550, partial [Stegodyphus mimosarum]